jgi:hypothetical protein
VKQVKIATGVYFSLLFNRFGDMYVAQFNSSQSATVSREPLPTEPLLESLEYHDNVSCTHSRCWGGKKWEKGSDRYA